MSAANPANPSKSRVLRTVQGAGNQMRAGRSARAKANTFIVLLLCHIRAASSLRDAATVLSNSKKK